MKLTMLGTGNALAVKTYNTCFVLSEGHEHTLVDGGGGNGIFHQLNHDPQTYRSFFWCHLGPAGNLHAYESGSLLRRGILLWA